MNATEVSFHLLITTMKSVSLAEQLDQKQRISFGILTAMNTALDLVFTSIQLTAANIFKVKYLIKAFQCASLIRLCMVGQMVELNVLTDL